MEALEFNFRLTNEMTGETDIGVDAPVALPVAYFRGYLGSTRLLDIWFLRTSIVALAVTGLLKALSVVAGGGILFAPDPVLGIPFRWLMLGGAVTELAIAGLLSMKVSYTWKLLVIFWLGACFCMYHLVLLIMDPAALCPCLGTLYGKFGVSPSSAEAGASFLASYFLLGPLVLGLKNWYFGKIAGKNV